jgi:hypothetical protein
MGLVVASLLPPPFPFTPFVVAAAVSQLPRKRTFGAIATGRSIRYLLEGLLALAVGNRVVKLLESEPFQILMLSLFVIAAVGTGFSVYRWTKR